MHPRAFACIGMHPHASTCLGCCSHTGTPRCTMHPQQPQSFGSPAARNVRQIMHVPLGGKRQQDAASSRNAIDGICGGIKTGSRTPAEAGAGSVPCMLLSPPTQAMFSPTPLVWLWPLGQPAAQDWAVAAMLSSHVNAGTWCLQHKHSRRASRHASNDHALLPGCPGGCCQECTPAGMHQQIHAAACAPAAGLTWRGVCCACPAPASWRLTAGRPPVAAGACAGRTAHPLHGQSAGAHVSCAR